VESFDRDLIPRVELRLALDVILDLERLLSRVTLETATPRDVLALAASLERVEAVHAAVGKFSAARLQALQMAINALPELRQRIEQTIVAEPPLAIADGGVIRNSVDAALDELRDLSPHSTLYIARIEARERQRTGI